jgi:ABC-2 type transport system ATP-binding protein
MIRLENITKKYGTFCAVDNVSLHVRAGEIFAFLGVNGAGKTTTIRMMTGILQPTSGQIFIGEHNMHEEPERAKLITGYIPDRPYIYNKLTGREFLYFVADLYLVPAQEAESTIDDLLKEYGLTQWQDELVENYSHGMKQRLATCAALVHHPKVLIVDEPMVGLDPHGAKLLKERFKLYAKSGVAIFLSTHSLNVAEEIADRIAIIHQGKIITVGTLEEIRALTGRSEEGLEEMFLQLTASFTD